MHCKTPQKGPLMWVSVGGEGRLPCIYVDGRNPGLTAPQYPVAPCVPSDMASAGWITRKWASEPPRNFSLVCHPNANEGLVEGSFVRFCVYFAFGSFPSEYGCVSPTPQPNWRIQKWKVVLRSDWYFQQKEHAVRIE